MGGCCYPPNMNGNFSPILFFAASADSNLPVAGTAEQTVLTLGVSPPSAGAHQVKLDLSVELLIAALLNPDYNLIVRLRRNDSASPIASLQISKRFSLLVSTTDSEIPNLTWNDTISSSVTYTITVQVVTSVGLSSITARTRALNAIVF
ncbi:hypothetical protein [Metabacillus sp. 84]|uniref:hypothetical protein n=1 Tax=unclassified Metabacillus TaxID=2675274 RepID=UPI003CF5CF31